MVAEVLGFTGELQGYDGFPLGCQVWLEDFDAGQKAVNLVQPITAFTPFELRT
jgi:hypothetical protein